MYSTFNQKRASALAIIIIFIIGVFTPIVHFGVLADASWPTGWSYRRQLTINGSLIGEALTDFPVLVKLDSSFFDFDEAKSSGEDVRFTGSDGTSMLKYEIERWNKTAGKAELWVKLPSVSSGSDTVFYVYYGNPAASDAQDSAGVWDSNFMMVHHLEEPSGTVTDSTSHHNDGDYSGTDRNVEGKIDGAYGFDGVNDYVFVSHNTSLNFGTGPFTISVWVKYSDNPSSDYDILRKGCTTNDPPSPSNYKMEVLGNKLSANLHQDGVGDVTVTSAGSYGDGNWHFIVVEREAQTMRLYVDMSLIGSVGSAGHDLTNSANMSIGSKDTLNDDFYAGLIDEVEISNTNRSQSWINASYHTMNNTLVTYGTEETFWADPDCRYRVKLTFNNSAASENLTDFPTLVVLNSSRIDYSKTSTTDIRFYDGGTLLSKETELWNASGNSYIWVKVPQIDNTNTDYIYAYYGATSTTNPDDAAGVWSDYTMVQHLDETSGTLTDSTANHHDGVAYGGVTLDYAGKIDGADDYSGTNSYSVINNSTAFNFSTTSFSYMLWFKSRATTTQYLLSKKQGTLGQTYRGYMMGISSDNALGYSVALGDGTTNVRINTGNHPSRGGNVWTMFTVVVDRTQQNMTVYIDGVLKGNASISAVGSVDNNMNFTLGKQADAASAYFNGALDEVCVLSASRSPSWVKAQYLSSSDQYLTFGSEESSSLVAPPIYSGMSYSTTMASEICEFSITWTDPDGLDKCIFSTDNSGAWTNTSITVSGTESLATSTITLTATPGAIVHYRWYCNDTLGNMADSGVQSLVTTSDNWPYAMKLTFDNSGASENLISFPVLVNLTRAGSSFWSHVNSNVNDLRFLDRGATTELYYEVEYWNHASQEGLVWVNVPQVDASSSSDFVWVCYGNPSPPTNTFNSPANVWNNYAMVQHLEETSGTVLTDSTSNHNDGTANGVSLNVAGQINGGDNYDGSASYSAVNDAASLNFGTNSFSYMFWFKSGAVTTQDVIDKKGGTADVTNAGYKLTISSVESTGFSAALGDGTNNARLNTGADSTRGGNVWAMFTVVVDRAQQKMFAYINGTAKANMAINSIGSVSNTKQLYLGKDVTGLGRNYNGSLDEVRIYNGSRSASWVHAEYLSMTDQYVTFSAEEEPPTPNHPPNKPSNPNPPSNATGVAASTTLNVVVTDPDGDPMDVSFYQVVPHQDVSNFTVVVLPDTQLYSESYPAIFSNQTQWIANNAMNMDIVYVTHEGDIVNVDTAAQWENADDSMSILETGNVPFGFAIGNHDTDFDSYFPYSRFQGKSWYGGAYNNNNTNSYSLFSNGPDEFLIFHFQYGVTTAVLDWANDVIGDYPNSRVIVTIHSYMSSSGSRSTDGNLVWTNFVSPHADQVFLVLCGHQTREYTRTDNVNGHNVYQLLADYQGDSNGGNGLLRILDFRPGEDKIYVKTYSPYLNGYETDSNSQFTLDYDMTGTTSTPTLVGVAKNVSSGTVASILWGGLNYSTTYQWYAIANDTSGAVAQSDTWNFTTSSGAAHTEMKVDTLTDALVGKEYTVYINVTEVTDLYGWEFQLNYDPSKLDLTYWTIADGGLNTPTNTFQSVVDETSGHLWWAVSTVYPTVNGIAYAEHAIFEMRFIPLATGVHTLALSETILSDSGANPIGHTTVNGQISVGTLDLIVTGVEIRNVYGNETWTHSVYANDTYSDGVTKFYYSVIVTIRNTGSISTGSFKVKLEVFYGAALESSGEISLGSLAGSTTVEVNFTDAFNPIHTGIAGVYSLKATVDSENKVAEDDELNNYLAKNDFMVTIMGDVNGDRRINIVDAVRLSLAWNAQPSDARWKIEADLNHDDWVDVLDGSRIGVYWGRFW